MTCEHGFIGACSVCDGSGQTPATVLVAYSRDIKTGANYITAMGDRSWIEANIRPAYGCELVTRAAYPCELEDCNKVPPRERDLSGGELR